MTTCREPACRRQPAYPGQGFCREHAPKWLPEWRRRAAANALPGKDYTKAA